MAICNGCLDGQSILDAVRVLAENPDYEDLEGDLAELMCTGCPDRE